MWRWSINAVIATQAVELLERVRTGYQNLLAQLQATPGAVRARNQATASQRQLLEWADGKGAIAWVWVEDCANDSYNGAPTDGSAWARGDCSRPMVSGGSFIVPPLGLRSAARDRYPSSSRFDTIGFRVAPDAP